MERRNTIQRNLVLQAVQALHGHVTADEVYAWIAAHHPSIGKGTVYRNLNILAETGEIRKIVLSGASDCYDFTTREHYHVRCVKCHKVEDVEMEVLPDLMEQIQNTHGHVILGHDIMFRGICSACLEKSTGGSNHGQESNV